MNLTIDIPDEKIAQLLLEKIRTGCNQPAQSVTNLPKIGEAWPNQGGIFAGIMRDPDSGKDYALIFGCTLPEGKFNEMQKTAAGLSAGGHQDFQCPSRRELRLLFINLKDRFEERYYWSCERHADDDDYAWCQCFVNGNQGSFNVYDTCLGCAVRRIYL